MAVRVGKASDLQPGRIAGFLVDGKSVAVANVDSRYFAFDDICPPRGCRLSEGPLEGIIVTCPCHASQFDVTNGGVVTGPATVAQDTFQVEIVGDELWVSTDAKPSPPAAETATSLLAQVALFAGLDSAALESLEAFTFRRRFGAKEVIVEEGRTGNGLYVVLSGRVEVVKGLGSATRQTVALLGPGEPFGEMALLGDWRRSASVVALEETECLGMDRWAFLTHLNRQPQLAIRILQLQAERLAKTNEKLIE